MTEKVNVKKSRKVLWLVAIVIWVALAVAAFLLFRRNSLPSKSRLNSYTLDQSTAKAIDYSGATASYYFTEENGKYNVFIALEFDISRGSDIGVDSAQKQMAKIIEYMQWRDDILGISFDAFAFLGDAYGNPLDPVNVLIVGIDKEHMENINFNKFDYWRLPDVSNTYIAHSILNQ